MKAQRRRSTGFRPRLETLEERCVPADFSGTISGTAFVDRNRNGILNRGETVFQGAPVQLIGRTTQGVSVNVVSRATAAGAYRFDNVMPGTYRLIGAATGRLPGRATSVVLTEGQSVTRNVAFGPLRSSGVNLRQFLNTSGPSSIPIPPAGTGVGQATFRPNNKPIVKGTLADVTISKNESEATFVDMAAYFDDVDMTNSQIRFKTSAGNINVELYDRAAPQTVANFFNYITSNAYDSTVFHRLATGFVLQAGGFTYNQAAGTFTEIPDGPQVKNEPGTFNSSDPVQVARSNLQYTIAMAKIPAVDDLGNPIPNGGPDSATNQFFFNLANNSSNLNNQNGGFTVFGKLVGTADQTVLNALAAYTPTNQSATNGAFDAFPLKNYTGTNFPTDVTPANLALVTDVEVIRRDENLTYTIVSNTNPAAVSAVFVNNQLKLNPAAAGATGTATITVRATDRFGATVDRTFDVTVANDAPTAALTLTPSAITNDDTLTASVAAADANGDAVTVNYVWTVQRGAAPAVEVFTESKGGPSTTSVLDLTQVTHVDLPGGVRPGDTLVVTATPNDGTVDGTPATATRVVGDREPVMGTLNFTNGEVGVDGTLTVEATGSDPDGTAVTFNYVWSYQGTVVKTTTGGAGSDSLDLTDLDTTHPGITRQTGDVVSVSVTPVSGSLSGSPSSASFTVNRTPTLSDADGIDDQVFSNPGDYTFDAAGDFSEPDGDALTFNATLSDGAALPAWLSISPNGILSGDPAPADAGVYEIKVTATDPFGKFVESTFTLTVINNAPVIDTLTLTDDPIETTSVLEAVVTASDVNGDAVTVNYVWTVTRGADAPVVVQTFSGAASSTNTLSLAGIPTEVLPGGIMAGDVVRVTVTPTDGVLAGTAEFLERTVVIV